MLLLTALSPVVYLCILWFPSYQVLLKVNIGNELFFAIVHSAIQFQKPD